MRENYETTEVCGTGISNLKTVISCYLYLTLARFNGGNYMGAVAYKSQIEEPKTVITALIKKLQKISTYLDGLA